MKRKQEASIGSMSRFLLVSNVALVLFPILILGSLSFTLLDSHFRHESAATVRSIMRSVAAESSRNIGDTYRLVESLSDRFSFSSLPLTEMEAAILETAQTTSQGILSIVVLSPDYRVVEIAPKNPDILGADYSRRPFLIDLPEKKPTLSMPFVDPETGNVNVAVARKSGAAIVIVFLNLETLSDSLKGMRFSPKDEVALADGTGAFIAHTDRALVRQRAREPMHAELRKIGGESLIERKTEARRFLAAGLPVEGTPWTVMYYRDAIDAYFLIQNLTDRYLIAILFIAITATVSALLSRRAFSERISALLSYIEKVESTEGSIDIRYGDDPWREFREIGSAFIAMAARIKEREAALLKSEDQYRELFLRNKAPTLIIDYNSGRILDANPSAKKYYGFSDEELFELRFQDLTASCEGETYRQVHGQCKQRLASGEIRDVETYSSSVDWEGKLGLYTIVIDTTERRIAEEQVAHSLEEKNVLLREIHHRVKNNLQIMASLLHLQSRYVKDAADEALFEASQDRIRSMALIHELIYQREDLSSVDLAEYANSLVRYYADGALSVEAKIDTECVSVSTTPDIALPFGLILNELLTNSIKYAFPPERQAQAQCQIVVKIKPNSDGQFVLEYSDNGIGLPPEVDPKQTETLGFSLIRILSAQLGAKPIFTSGPGFGIIVVLKKLERTLFAQ